MPGDVVSIPMSMTGLARYAIRQPKRRRGNFNVHPTAPDKINPTPETALKNHPDPLDKWPEMKDIGLEIARIHAAIISRVNARAQRYEEGRSTKSTRSESDPLDRISRAKRDKYDDWMQVLGYKFIPQFVVLEVIAEMTPPYILDERLRRPPGTVGSWVKLALDLYGKGRP